MPTSASPPARKGFDYDSLDAETTQFIQQQTGEIRVLMKRTAQDIFEIGQKLIEVKERLGHGSFGDWLSDEFEWSWDTANRFMNVAKRLGNIPLHAEFEARALYLLAAPSTPETARSEALARAEAGETITYTAAKAIKQKHAPPSTKLELEPAPEPELEIIPQLQPSPVPEVLAPLGPKPEIVAVRRREQSLQSAPTFPGSQSSVRAPEQSSVWWQLGGRHLLYCGNPNSPEFIARITEEKVGLLLSFSPPPGWQPAIQVKTHLLTMEYLPQGKDIRLFEDMLEAILLLYSDVGDIVCSYFLPSLEILSIINRLDRRGLFVEPDSRRVNAVISDWKRAGMKAERLS